MRFKITLVKDEDGWFVATCPSLPGCISQGRTEKSAVKNMKQAIQLHVRSLAQDGLPLLPENGKKDVIISVAV